MTETTPRQVLYGLVAAAFWLVVLVLVVGSAVAGLSPPWWTTTMAIMLLASLGWGVAGWRRTVPLLVGSILLLCLWAVGTLLVV